MDALELEKLLFVHTFHPTVMPQAACQLEGTDKSEGHLVGQRAPLVNQLQCAIEQIALLFPDVLAPETLTALTLVSQFPTPYEWMKKVNHKIILNLLETLPSYLRLQPNY